MTTLEERIDTFPQYRITHRQLEVLQHAARGESNREIGERLGITEKTVGTHLKDVYHRTGTHTRIAACVATGVLRWPR